MINYDGMEAAIVAKGTRAGKPVLVYDYNKCVDILMTRDSMTVDEAIEFMEFNVVSMYVGEQTPIFIRGDSLLDED
jgi:hypothetical protein